MAKSNLNKTMQIGHLGGDPELKYTPSGTANVTFNLATNRAWKDKDGNKQEVVNWTRCVAWGKLAEIIGEWLKKGSKVYIEGRLETRSYDDKDGQKKYITEVVASDMEMLGNKGDTQDKAPKVPGRDTVQELDESSDVPF